jgi:hypothetical protein
VRWCRFWIEASPATRPAEELDSTSVFTTDRTDFSVYRVKGRRLSVSCPITFKHVQ